MAGGETHSYTIPLTSGQYAQILVEQHGINVALKLFDVLNNQTIEIDSPSGAHGPEYVSAVAVNSGQYRLEVKSIEDWANPGRYKIALGALREATPEDRKRLEAEKAFADGQQLMAKGTKESREGAIAKFRESLTYWQGAGDHHWQAISLYSECASRRRLGDSEGAAKCFDNSLSIPLDERDWRLKATILNDRGLNLSSLGRQQEALASLNEALALFRQKQDRRGQASGLNNLGIVYATAGQMIEAIKHYKEAVPLRQAENDRAGEVNIYNNIGGVYDFLGEPHQALQNYNKALEVWVELDARGKLTDADKLGTGYNNVAVAYDRLGEWQRALESYERALKVFERTGNSRVEMSTLDNLGELYGALGDHDRALKYLNRAILLYGKVKQPELMGNVLIHAGQSHLSQGSLSEALSNFEKALELSQTRAGKASARTNLGSAQALQGKMREALASYEEVLRPYEEALKLGRGVESPRSAAAALHKRGETYALMGDRAKALADFNEALRLWKGLEDKRGEASSLLGLARVERDDGRLAEAVRRSEEALGIVESLRTKVASQRLRTTYFATNQDYYEVYIDLKMKLYELDRSRTELAATAFHASERSRARSLIDRLGEAQVDIRAGAGTDLLARERELQQRINAKARAKSEYKHTDEQAAALDVELDALITEYDDVLTKIRINSPNAAHLLQPQVLSLKEIQQQLLDHDTLLLEFHLGQDKSYLWAVSNTSISGYTLPERDVIEEAARRLYGLMTAPQPAARGDIAERRKLVAEAKAQFTSQATALSHMLLGKVAGQLGKKRLLVVGDGVLQYLPFSALPAPPLTVNDGPAGAGATAAPAPPRYLIEEHEIVNLPSASVLAVLRGMNGTPRRAATTVAVFADPALLGTNEAHDLEAVLTGQEAAAIRDVAGAEHTLLLRGVDASRVRLMNLKPGQYRIIHFATHGQLNDKHPELSGIELANVNGKGEPQDGVLRLQDIYNLKLPSDMVVLSACSTGLGNIVKGEGLIGLTRGFMYAGASRVVASSWKVDDHATALLMQRFYQLLLKERRTPPAALRQAQSEMLKEKRWNLPYYWAAFFIQGEWRGINQAPS
jgi:CHAT domain-containing protein/Tfp pilus assembly protein PilF